MIRRVWLKSWKAFEELDLRLPSGTVFIVADNGIGKTSIVQAICFSIFGGEHLIGSGQAASTLDQAVRGPVGTTAVAGCELDIAGNLIWIQRSVTRTERRPEASVEIKIDGVSASESQLTQLLVQHTGADLIQLSTLSVVPEGSVFIKGDAGLDVAAMLSATFRVDQLLDVAAKIDRDASKLGKDADRDRKQLRDVPAKVANLTTGALEEEHQDLQSQVATLRARQEERIAYGASLSRWEAYDAQLREIELEQARTRSGCLELTTKAISDLQEILPLEAPSPEASAEGAASVLIQRLQEYRSELADRRSRCEGKIEGIDAAVEAISTGDGICPTCLRPLDEAEAADALERHASERAENTEAISVLRSHEIRISEWSLRIEQALREINTIEVRAPEGERPILPGNDVEDAPEAISRRIAELDEQRVRVLAELRSIQSADEVRRENVDLSDRLFDQYRRAERGQALADTMRRVAQTITSERIAPLAREFEKRWGEIWASDSVQMTESGELVLKSAERDVPYAQFSGGQRTVAQVLLRLLAVTMVTRCPFLVLDEPLEHLDPRTRRIIASLLVRATSPDSSLDQVVVTTYEESVTRRLSAAPVGDLELGDRPSSIVRVSASTP